MTANDVFIWKQQMHNETAAYVAVNGECIGTSNVQWF